ncbi:MAG: nitroreductase family protein [Candidatus Cryptobacteroides sp.]
MNSFKDLAQQRRSHRQYTEEPVSQEELRTVLRAALMSPTGMGLRKWSFAVTSDKSRIEALSRVRTHGSAFLAEAPTVIAVMGSPAEQEMWVEDGSIAAVSMQYQAEDLGLGTCWCQIRGRESTVEGVSADSLVREILGIGEDRSVLCLIALGHPRDERKPQNEEALKWEQVEMPDAD